MKKILFSSALILLLIVSVFWAYGDTGTEKMKPFLDENLDPEFKGTVTVGDLSAVSFLPGEDSSYKILFNREYSLRNKLTNVKLNINGRDLTISPLYDSSLSQNGKPYVEVDDSGNIIGADFILASDSILKIGGEELQISKYSGVTYNKKDGITINVPENQKISDAIRGNKGMVRVTGGEREIEIGNKYLLGRGSSLGYKGSEFFILANSKIELILPEDPFIPIDKDARTIEIKGSSADIPLRYNEKNGIMPSGWTVDNRNGANKANIIFNKDIELTLDKGGELFIPPFFQTDMAIRGSGTIESKKYGNGRKYDISASGDIKAPIDGSGMLSLSIQTLKGKALIQGNSISFVPGIESNADRPNPNDGVTIEYSGGPATKNMERSFKNTKVNPQILLNLNENIQGMINGIIAKVNSGELTPAQANLIMGRNLDLLIGGTIIKELQPKIIETQGSVTHITQTGLINDDQKIAYMQELVGDDSKVNRFKKDLKRTGTSDDYIDSLVAYMKGRIERYGLGKKEVQGIGNSVGQRSSIFFEVDLPQPSDEQGGALQLAAQKVELPSGIEWVIVGDSASDAKLKQYINDGDELAGAKIKFGVGEDIKEARVIGYSWQLGIYKVVLNNGESKVISHSDITGVLTGSKKSATPSAEKGYVWIGWENPDFNKLKKNAVSNAGYQVRYFYHDSTSNTYKEAVGYTTGSTSTRIPGMTKLKPNEGGESLLISDQYIIQVMTRTK